MNPLKTLTTPEYLFRPGQIFTRLARAMSRERPEFATVRLPWGDDLRVRPHEVIGASIWNYGIFDLGVAEAIMRLVDPGETALDVGANIGQMTSVLRYRAGTNGKVIAFEPHPALFAELSYNAGLAKPGGRAPVQLVNLALSDAVGESVLDPGPEWRANRGTSKLVRGAAAGADGTFEVRLTTLDAFLPERPGIGLMKVDVEGHELEVFTGGAGLLAHRCVRDILFEELGTYPTKVHSLLLGHGYTLFALHTGTLGPAIGDVRRQPTFREGRGENYLATLEPERARQRFRPMAWRALQGR